MHGPLNVKLKEDVSYELHITLILNNFSYYKVNLLHSVRNTNSKSCMFMILIVA